MPCLRKTIFDLLMITCLCPSLAPAQTSERAQIPAPEINIIVSQQTVRFVAPTETHEARLEIYNDKGELVFDSGVTTVTTLDWPLRDQQGQPIGGGQYVYKLTIKEGGETSRTRTGYLVIHRASTPDEVWVISKGTVGAGTAGTELTVIGNSEATIAGASLPEQPSSITPAKQPSEAPGMKEPSGKGQINNPNALNLAAPITGEGRVNSIAKFTAGDSIGNSAISEVSGKIGIGVVNPTAKLHVSDSTLAALQANSNSSVGLVATSNTAPALIASSISNYGLSARSSQSTAVFGWGVIGLHGQTSSTNGIGVIGLANANSGLTNGVYGRADSKEGYGVQGYNPLGNGVYGESDSANGVYGRTKEGIGVKGLSAVGTGVYGQSGADIFSYSTGTGVLGRNSGFGAGVLGISEYGYGVKGSSTTGVGVYGENRFGVFRIGNRPGVWGQGLKEDGVWAISEEGNGLYARGKDNAGYFNGNVYVGGRLTKSSGSFKIDHPLDPANKYLSHSFVESPEMMNIYSGVATLSDDGTAVVQLPVYFEALNRDVRYQLTAIGAPGPNLYIAEEVRRNSFKIAGGMAGMKVSWLVTGVRQDAYAKNNPILVEEEKSDSERGTYLHPAAYNQPPEKGVNWRREHPNKKQ